MSKYTMIAFIWLLSICSHVEVYGQSTGSIRGLMDSERKRSEQNGFNDNHSSNTDTADEMVATVTERKKLELFLQASIKRFESSNSKFGVSSDTDDLIANGGLLDRMVVEVNLVKKFEKRAEALGIAGVVKLRQKMEAIVNSQAKRLYSDADAIQTRAAFENAMRYLRDF